MLTAVHTGSVIASNDYLYLCRVHLKFPGSFAKWNQVWLCKMSQYYPILLSRLTRDLPVVIPYDNMPILYYYPFCHDYDMTTSDLTCVPWTNEVKRCNVAWLYQQRICVRLVLQLLDRKQLTLICVLDCPSPPRAHFYGIRPQEGVIDVLHNSNIF